MAVRVAVLLANDDTSPFSLKFPNDGEKVVAQMALLRPTWEYTVWPVKDGVFPKVTDADAFIITGSPASVHDALPWIAPLTMLVREIHRETSPLIGLCFGHQLIATALGGEVKRSSTGWRFGAVETVMARHEDWMQPECTTLRLFASHSEQVTRLPFAAERLGSNSYCPNAAFGIGRHVLTTQYHPEFTVDFMKQLALEYQGEVPEQVLQTGRRELDLSTDGAAFFRWVVNLIELGGRE